MARPAFLHSDSTCTIRIFLVPSLSFLGGHGLRLILVVLLLGRLRLSAEALHLPRRDHAAQQEGAEHEQPEVNPERGVVPEVFRFFFLQGRGGRRGKQGNSRRGRIKQKKRKRRESGKGRSRG